jgi:predicted RNA binding protein YcfA (HicA-like mRNA interferase family)
MKVADAVRILGWYWVGSRGGHRQYKHALRPGRLTVAGKATEGLAPGALESLLKHSGYIVEPSQGAPR